MEFAVNLVLCLIIAGITFALMSEGIWVPR